jgi:probable DNA repair protein
LELPSRITIAGFDRLTPQTQSLLDALSQSGCQVDSAGEGPPGSTCLLAYDNNDAELRAAGAWARREFEHDAEQRIGVIVTNLGRDAIRCTHLLREGLVPGWQYADANYAAAVNVSYGRKLADYSAVAIALLVLHWLSRGLSSNEASLLLRTSLLGSNQLAGRSRLELILRQWPDRAWTLSLLSRALRGRDDTDDSLDWVRRIDQLEHQRRKFPASAVPATWAELIDKSLKTLNWPGSGSLNSADFQVINRWRELMNEFARLELVNARMTLTEAVGRLAMMARETLFQPEAEGAILQVLGPLEAAGMYFDKLWITGLSAANWPPAGRPLALVSRRLQQRYGMPDAEPSDTTAYAQRVLSRLLRSAADCNCSYSLTDGDAEQTATGLLAEIDAEVRSDDPGWHAAQLLIGGSTRLADSDPVPAVNDDETISGGAATIQRQFVDPIAAFAYGRLGIGWLQPMSSGLSPSLRGSLIHDALCRLYSDLPSQATIAGWTSSVLEQKILAAIEAAFTRRERYSDGVLGQLFALERQRVAGLLRRLVAVDLEREPFQIACVEEALEVSISGIDLRLRCDRIDRFEDGAVLILDYKTGASKKFLDRQGEPRDVQLVVYACAVRDAVAGMGLYNVDSRLVAIDGAERSMMSAQDWEQTLARWKADVATAAGNFQQGDVRVNARQSIKDARALNLLSRFTELRRDH